MSIKLQHAKEIRPTFGLMILHMYGQMTATAIRHILDNRRWKLRLSMYPRKALLRLFSHNLTYRSMDKLKR